MTGAGAEAEAGEGTGGWSTAPLPAARPPDRTARNARSAKEDAGKDENVFAFFAPSRFKCPMAGAEAAAGEGTGD